jgi:hypothetical protein
MKLNFNIFKNDKKEKESHPDYNMSTYNSDTIFRSNITNMLFFTNNKLFAKLDEMIKREVDDIESDQEYIEERVDNLEDKLDALIDHLGLESTKKGVQICPKK